MQYAAFINSQRSSPNPKRQTLPVLPRLEVLSRRRNSFPQQPVPTKLDDHYLYPYLRLTDLPETLAQGTDINSGVTIGGRLHVQ